MLLEDHASSSSLAPKADLDVSQDTKAELMQEEQFGRATDSHAELVESVRDCTITNTPVDPAGNSGHLNEPTTGPNEARQESSAYQSVSGTRPSEGPAPSSTSSQEADSAFPADTLIRYPALDDLPVPVTVSRKTRPFVTWHRILVIVVTALLMTWKLAASLQSEDETARKAVEWFMDVPFAAL